jgi:hypothetical protein
MAKILHNLAFHAAKGLYWHPILTYSNLWAGLTQIIPFSPSPNIVPFPLT